MSSVLDMVKSKRDLKGLTFEPLPQLKGKYSLGKIVVSGLFNGRVEDFITVAYIKGQMYIIGFIGMTCICKQVDVKVVEGDPTKNFTLSINKQLLKVLNGKEDLTLEIKDNTLLWAFKYGEGYIVKRMKPSNSIYDIKPYVEFILSSDIKDVEGEVSSSLLKKLRKVTSAITTNPMEKNVVLGEGFAYNVLPTFAIFTPSTVKGNLVLTESIVSNLPKTDTTFKVQNYEGFSGLMGRESSTYIIFKSNVVEDIITPHTQLELKWLGEIDDKVAKAIGVISFGEDIEVEIQLTDRGTVHVSDTTNPNNKYIGICKVTNPGSIILNSCIKDIPNIKRIGIVSTKGKEHIKALQLEGGEICLIR